MGNLIFAAIIVGVISLLYTLVLYNKIKKAPAGSKRMIEIQSYIKEGAMAFLKREYQILIIFVIIVFLSIAIFLGIGPKGNFVNSLLTAINFLLGALLSALAGYLGMKAATNANARTANAAHEEGLNKALRIAFSGGTIMGLVVVGFGLLGISVIYYVESIILKNNTSVGIQDVINGFGLGASSIALFARVGGGIYTKAADIGADLVGKVESGIPEDDPRNPAVIADNVGDNVGDVAGMGADLFESYVGSIIAAITLGITLIDYDKLTLKLAIDINEKLAVALFPILISAAGILAAIIGTFFVKTKKNANPHKSLNLGTYISALVTIIGAFLLSYLFFGNNLGYFFAIVSGILVGLIIGSLTEIYTSSDYRFVKGIAEQSKTGAATTIISGLSVGMVSTVFPIIFIAIGTIISYIVSDSVYGIALSAVGMLSIVGNTIAVDAYGPIADNAGGIAEMADLPKNVREITDKLDSVGNTTAAIGKGFAIGSAALTALALFVSYAYVAFGDTLAKGEDLLINLLDVRVVVGLLLGAMLPFLFSALTMSSVSKAACDMIEEVRRQFREVPGIMDGTAKPDYARCVDISTKAALREMIVPGLIAIIAPIVTGIVLGASALAGLLAGSLVSGIMLAIFMANSGGAWDNAKKFIEVDGDKSSDTHKAAVVGDTVGDPFKDAAGPSLNILIKLMTIVALVFATLFGNGLLSL